MSDSFFKEFKTNKVLGWLVLSVVFFLFAPSSLSANGSIEKLRRPIASQVVNLREMPMIACDPAMPKCFCHRTMRGNLEVLFKDSGNADGKILLQVESILEFSSEGTGKIFFYPDIKAGWTDEGKLSSRNYFCIATKDGNIGYEWDGKSYQPNTQATKHCPIDLLPN